MTQNLKFFQGMKVLPILAPAASWVATEHETSYVDLNHLHWATLAIQFGAITCAGATVTLEASSAGTSTSAIAIGFQYRLSTAVDTDDTDAGAVTTATSTGAAIAVTDDNKILFVEVDPSAVQAVGADYRYVRAVIAPTAGSTVCFDGVVCYGETRYPGNATISAT